MATTLEVSYFNTFWLKRLKNRTQFRELTNDPNPDTIYERGGGTTNYMVSDYEKEKGEQFDLGFKSTGGGATLRETVLDSPVTVCLSMSFQKLIRGGYDPKFRYLRDAVSISYLLAK